MQKKRPIKKNPLEFSKSSDGAKAFRSVVHYLSKRDHSTHELKQKMKNRYTDDVIAAAIERAQTHKYIKAEAQLAKELGESLGRRDKSLRQINATLKKRGLPGLTSSPEVELAKCREVFIKKFGQNQKLSTPERVKAVRYLTYRGFDFETINKTIKNQKSDDL